VSLPVFKIGGRSKGLRRVRFPSASAIGTLASDLRLDLARLLRATTRQSAKPERPLDLTIVPSFVQPAATDQTCLASREITQVFSAVLRPGAESASTPPVLTDVLAGHGRAEKEDAIASLGAKF
jgi:hypothetical protein